MQLYHIMQKNWKDFEVPFDLNKTDESSEFARFFDAWGCCTDQL